MTAINRDANSKVVMAGVDYATGEIRPLLVDHATGYVLINIFGATDPGATTPENRALHDANNKTTMIAVEEGTTNITGVAIDHRTVNANGGFVWLTII